MERWNQRFRNVGTRYLGSFGNSYATGCMHNSTMKPDLSYGRIKTQLVVWSVGTIQGLTERSNRLVVWNHIGSMERWNYIGLMGRWFQAGRSESST